MPRCPHTMKVRWADGRIVCGDCGKAVKVTDQDPPLPQLTDEELRQSEASHAWIQTK